MNDFKPRANEPGDRIGEKLPTIDFNNPAELESWFGPFGFFDYYRKVVLSNCQEIVRASAAMQNMKLTESRIDAMAHTHGLYLDFLIDGLKGRRKREKMVREALTGYGR